MGVIVAAGAPGEEVGAIFHATSLKHAVGKTEQSVVRLPTAVALPVRTWNENVTSYPGCNSISESEDNINGRHDFYRFAVEQIGRYSH